MLYSSREIGRVPQGSTSPIGSCPTNEYASANQPAPTTGGNGSCERNFFEAGSNTRAPINVSSPIATVPEPVNDTPCGSPALVSTPGAVTPTEPVRAETPSVWYAPAVWPASPTPGIFKAPKPIPVVGTPGTPHGLNPPSTPAWENPPSAPAAGILPAPSSCGAVATESHSSGTVSLSVPVTSTTAPLMSVTTCTRELTPVLVSCVVTAASAPVMPHV